MDALMEDLEALPDHLQPPDSPSCAAASPTSPTSSSPSNARARCSATATRPSSTTTSSRAPTASGSRPRSRSRRPRGPALIVVHGLFTSSRFDYVRQIAVRAFYEWGFNVAALDLRSFGMTELTSPAPSTAGWKEGEDILALARYMKELGSTSVGALGISLGGSSVLNASDVEETPTRSTAASSRSRRPPCRSSPGSGSPSRSPGPSPLSAPPGLPGGADLAGALGPLAPGGGGHAACDGARLGALLRGHAPTRSGRQAAAWTTSATPRCRCWSSTPRTT